MLYPWQLSDYSALCDSYREGSFSALLLHGGLNSAAEGLVQSWLNWVLCLNPQADHACGNCAGCRLYQHNNHPDYYLLAAEAGDEVKNPTLKVEQVRAMIDFCATGPHVSAVKLIYIPVCSELTMSSANALLKVLEEPPAYCRFILQAAVLNRLLPTLRSRCFKYQLQRPSPQQALSLLEERGVANAAFWLKYFAGEPCVEPPLTSEQLESLINKLLAPSVENIFEISREFDPKKIGMATLSEFLLKWLADLVQVKLGVAPSYFSQVERALNKLTTRLDLDKLYALQAELLFIQEWSQHPLNHKLQLENLLFKYQQLYA